MTPAWMPLNIADYLRDTTHLSAAEHGAYLLLIMHYWVNEGLPNEDRKLARIARMSEKEWKKSRQTLSEFFSENWRHKRVDFELAESRERYERRAAAGRNGGNSRALRMEQSKQCSSNATAMPEQCSSREGSNAVAGGLANAKQTATNNNNNNNNLSSLETDDNLRQTETRARRASVSDLAFERFWAAWPNKVGKPAAAKAFAKVSPEIDAILEGLARYVSSKPPDRPWLNPSTFLNQRRWEDEPAGPATSLKRYAP